MLDRITLPACTQEDGSTPGQQFPCQWDAALMGNGQGQSFTLASASSEPVYQPAAPAHVEPLAWVAVAIVASVVGLLIRGRVQL